jgi:hypothetical protein
LFFMLELLELELLEPFLPIDSLFRLSINFTSLFEFTNIINMQIIYIHDLGF